MFSIPETKHQEKQTIGLVNFRLVLPSYILLPRLVGNQITSYGYLPDGLAGDWGFGLSSPPIGLVNFRLVHLIGSQSGPKAWGAGEPRWWTVLQLAEAVWLMVSTADKPADTKGLFGFHKSADLLSQATENQGFISHVCLVVDDL